MLQWKEAKNPKNNKHAFLILHTLFLVWDKVIRFYHKSWSMKSVANISVALNMRVTQGIMIITMHRRPARMPHFKHKLVVNEQQKSPKLFPYIQIWKGSDWTFFYIFFLFCFSFFIFVSYNTSWLQPLLPTIFPRSTVPWFPSEKNGPLSDINQTQHNNMH